MKPNKKCHVCGDYAYGFNYNGLSCESCKVFFCRNSSKADELKCEAFSKCPITKTNRKECPKCRLNKCFAIGMTKQHRPKQNFGEVNKIDKIIEISILRKYSNHELANVQNYISFIETSPRKRSTYELNKFELERISEVQQAIRVFGDETTAEIVKVASVQVELTDLITIYDIYIRNIIKYCHNLAPFNILSSMEQLALVKKFSFDVIGIRTSFLFEVGKGMPIILDEVKNQAVYVNVSIGNQIDNQFLLNQNTQFAIELHEEMGNDLTIRDLLSAIYLFKHYDDVSMPEVFRYNYVLYSRLLQRYLEHKCKNVKQGKRKYQSMMSLLQEMTRIKDNGKVLVREIKEDRVPQILNEIYEIT